MYFMVTVLFGGGERKRQMDHAEYRIALENQRERTMTPEAYARYCKRTYSTE